MFSKLRDAISKQITKMAEGDLFVTDASGLVDIYLLNLPHELRQEHNCNSCKSFIKHYGKLVSIKDGKVTTLWDIVAGPEYTVALKALKNAVLSATILYPFISKTAKIGTESTISATTLIKWTHMCGVLPATKVNSSYKSVESIRAAAVATKDVFERSLETISQAAVNEVLTLIEENSLYRGQEFKTQLVKFRDHLINYAAAPNKSIYIWSNYVDGGRIRNTAIGTLLVNLSEGMDLEEAVRKFEAIMAPTNYRRTTALVTPSMIKAAEKKVEELGLTDSLPRRHATMEDIPLDKMLWVNRPQKKNKNVFATMADDAPVKEVPKNLKEVSLDAFVSEVLSKANTIEILTGSNPNIVSLTTAQDTEAKSLFSWGNHLAWAYKGNLADALVEKVKKAGGSVDGKLRVSLEWFNFDDLDLHVYEPSGFHIYYAQKHGTCGILDVDMNAGGPSSREPVENIIFKKLPDGIYKVCVNQFNKRENKDFGFNLQIACGGEVRNYNWPKAVAGMINAIEIKIKGEKIVAVQAAAGLSDSLASKDVAGISTNTFVPVDGIMWSPNHWDTGVGNKHIFFISSKVKMDEPVRPFFNEYLAPALNENRKVLEMLANRMMIEPSNDQLSGFGFSTTQKADIVLRVDGKFIKVKV